MAPPPGLRREVETFRTGPLVTFSRFLVWTGAALRYFVPNFWDRLCRRASIERRAERLCRILQHTGVTFVKFGQQLSIRVDLLPYAYTHELEKLLDEMQPFPFEQAVAALERMTGKPLEETFAAIDPEPIGSASVACVYQAVLQSGERVAVKVRRPGIGELFAADMRAMGWVLRMLEILTLLREGLVTNLLYELRGMLLEEFDFVKEARYTELFRRQLKKSKLRFVSVPRVFVAQSGADVLTTEFVEGVWLNEVLAAVEQDDRAALETLRGMDIDPKAVAKRYLKVNRFGGFEGLFFHADLHPANIVVHPENRITLVDFGSCGAFTKQETNAWRRLLYYQARDDVGNMAQAAMTLLEPLPPIDAEEFRKRLEAVFWQDLYAFKSKHSRWWEKTSANIWLSLLDLIREFKVPARLNLLRMIRATLLADTIAARLDHKVDHYKEYQRYERSAGKRAAKRLQKRFKKFFEPSTLVRVEQFFDAVAAAGFRAQQILDNRPILNFSRVIGKAAFGVGILFRTALFLGVVTLLVAIPIAVSDLLHHPPTSLHDLLWERPILGKVLRELFASRLYLFLSSLVVVVNLRRFLFRLDDRDLDLERR
jgi:predicted unusual protein kinase regulating ubiquinone biosynthesis (AarF/ABC1/UbiB family)